MKIALECPTSLLGDIQPLADFDWILAHLVLQDKKYAEFYTKSKRFKVLDNSVNELLEPCSFEDLSRAAEVVEPNLVVSPDFLGNYSMTKQALGESIKVFGLERVYPVVQGDSASSAFECLDYILSLGFDRVAVPYDILSDRSAEPEHMAGRRLGIVSGIIHKVPIGFHIHLLGFNTIEELELHNRGWVRSVDTGVPIMMGLQGKRLDLDRLLDKKEPTLDRMKASWVDRERDLGKAYYNIAYLRKITNSD